MLSRSMYAPCLSKACQEGSLRTRNTYFSIWNLHITIPFIKKKIDGFFNWTATYKLDSDIPFPYIAIKNKQVVILSVLKPTCNGYKSFPKWMSIWLRLANKTKAAAWFVSHCAHSTGRNHFVKRLQKALQLYGLTLDVYGSCGPLKCPKNETTRCDAMLARDYFFYMSLENSFAEDYVLTALQHDTVPIAYGGANYSRFLPPGSYIDSKNFNVFELAATMDELMKCPEMYSRFFRWKSQYTYIDPVRTENVCAVCAAMNNKEKFETKSVHNEFRKWWNRSYFSTQMNSSVF